MAAFALSHVPPTAAAATITPAAIITFFLFFKLNISLSPYSVIIKRLPSVVGIKYTKTTYGSLNLTLVQFLTDS